MATDDLKNPGSRRFFESWDGYVSAQNIAASEQALRSLIEELTALGDTPEESSARAKVRACVQTFNELDNGWINSIERDDIVDRICEVIGLRGLDCAEEWFEDRLW